MSNTIKFNLPYKAAMLHYAEMGNTLYAQASLTAFSPQLPPEKITQLHNDIYAFQSQMTVPFLILTDPQSKQNLLQKIEEGTDRPCICNVPKKSIYTILKIRDLTAEICTFLHPNDISLAGRVNRYFFETSLFGLRNSLKMQIRTEFFLKDFATYYRTLHIPPSPQALLDIFPDAPFSRINLTFQEPDFLSDLILKIHFLLSYRIKNLNSLKSLIWGDFPTYSGVIGNIARNCPNLTRLSFQTIFLPNEEELVAIAENCPNLTHFGVSEEHTIIKTISIAPLNKVIAAFAAHSKLLTKLLIGGCAGISDASVIQLAESAPPLEELDLACTPISDKAVLALSKLKKLQRLNLDYCLTPSFEKISDVSIIVLASQLPNIKNLSLNYSAITDKGANAIAENCRQLEILNIGNSINITDEAIVNLINKCNKLTFLHFSNCPNITKRSKLYHFYVFALNIKKDEPSLIRQYEREIAYPAQCQLAQRYISAMRNSNFYDALQTCMEFEEQRRRMDKIDSIRRIAAQGIFFGLRGIDNIPRFMDVVDMILTDPKKAQHKGAIQKVIFQTVAKLNGRK